MPSYCTRHARATLDTVSPVESDTRWTWKLRPAMAQLTPQQPGEKRGIAPGNAGTVGKLRGSPSIQDPTRRKRPDSCALGATRIESSANRESPYIKPTKRRGRSTGVWGRSSKHTHPRVSHPLLLLLPIMNRVRGMHEGKRVSGGKLLETLAGTRFPTPPIWLMRQAGRYLPEYRAVRATTRSFLEFCYTPDKSVEVTLQPVRRFGLDAAIIFSDILVIPDALGQKVWFEEGEGPKLEALTDPADFGKLTRARLPEKLAPVYEAIRRTRTELPKETALLGFAGAPFTLACYMIEGAGSRDFAKVKLWAYRHPDSFALLIGLLPEEQLFGWSLEPMVRIAHGLRARHPKVPIIAFPRAVGPAALMYRRPDAFAALSLDTGL